MTTANGRNDPSTRGDCRFGSNRIGSVIDAPPKNSRTPATEGMRTEKQQIQNLMKLSTTATPLQGGLNELLSIPLISAESLRRGDRIGISNALILGVFQRAQLQSKMSSSTNDQDVSRIAVVGKCERERKSKMAAQRKEFEISSQLLCLKKKEELDRELDEGVTRL